MLRRFQTHEELLSQARKLNAISYCSNFLKSLFDLSFDIPKIFLNYLFCCIQRNLTSIDKLE